MSIAESAIVTLVGMFILASIVWGIWDGRRQRREFRRYRIPSVNDPGWQFGVNCWSIGPFKLYETGTVNVGAHDVVQTNSIAKDLYNRLCAKRNRAWEARAEEQIEAYYTSAPKPPGEA